MSGWAALMTTSRRPVRSSASVASFVVVLTAIGATSSRGQEPGRVDGQVLDAETGELVSEAAIQAINPDGTPVAAVVSDDEGRFSIDILEPGAYQLLVRHVAYGVSNDTLTVAPGEVLTLVYRIAARPIELAGISVTARATLTDPRLARGTRVDGMSAAEVNAIRPRVRSMADLLRAGNVPGFMIVEQGTRLCIESNRSRGSLPGTCGMVTVVVDDVVQTDPEGSLALMNPEAVESWELLPAIEAGTRYGGLSGNGVLEITTRSGTQLPQGFEGIASIGQRWALSAAFLANGATTLHEGVLSVSSSEGLASLTYIEKTNRAPGIELVGRWNSRSFGYLGITGYGAFGSSSAIYNLGPGGDLTAERGYSTVGFDLWWGAPLLRRQSWNANLAIGPSFQWQNLAVAGHPDELADPGSPTPPSVQWSDRSWFTPGAAFFADLGYDFGLSSGIFVGLSFRLFSTAGTSSWAELDQDAIFDATGKTVEVSYDSGIASSLGLRTGFRWYP